MIRFKFSLSGLMLLVLVAAVFAGVQWHLINPSLVQLLDGTYGEMERPVRVLRWPFYLYLFAVALVVFWRFFFVQNGRTGSSPRKILKYADAFIGAALAFVGVFIVWVAIIDPMLPPGWIGAIFGLIVAAWSFRGTWKKWTV